MSRRGVGFSGPGRPKLSTTPFSRLFMSASGRRQGRRPWVDEFVRTSRIVSAARFSITRVIERCKLLVDHCNAETRLAEVQDVLYSAKDRTASGFRVKT